MTDQRCENCRFWDTENDGECRRYPPIITVNTKAFSGLSADFPETNSDDWCGEWQGKDQDTTHGDTT